MNRISKRDILIFFYKYRRRLLMTFAITLLAVFAISLIPTPRYKASAVLIVRLGSEYVYRPEIATDKHNSDSAIPFNQNQIFKSEVAILNSLDLHSQVIQDIKIENIYPKILQTGTFSFVESDITPQEKQRRQIAAAVELFEKRFDILLEKDSAVIRLTFEHKSADIAVTALQKLLDLYMEKRREVYFDSRLSLAEKENKDSETSLKNAHLALEDFKRKNKIYSFADQRLQLLARKDAAEEKATVLNNPGLNAKIAEYRGKLEKLDALEKEYSKLQKEVEIANNLYSLASHKLKESQAFDELQKNNLSSVRIIQSPTIPEKAKDLQAIIMLLGLFIALITTFITAAITQFLSNGFTSTGEAEQITGLPVLTTFTQEFAGKELKRLIHGINLQMLDKPLNIITFISARHAEGSTQIADAYATAIAEITPGILLIDCTKNTFTSGIVDQMLTSNSVQTAITKRSDNLSVASWLTEEKNHAHAIELIHNQDFWQDLSENFPLIIIKAENVNQSFDGVALAAKSDISVVVIEAEKTPQAVVKNLCDLLNTAGARVAGIVINKQKHYIPDKIYNKL